MTAYKPPYSITTKMVNLISKISEELTRIEYNEKEIITPTLRKKNRAKTLAGTLAIEGNFLGEDKITALLDGKRVLGSVQEVTEVEGAINCYKELENFQHDDLDSLLLSHKILMKYLLDSPGTFRKVNVGVGSHIAPQSHLVPNLMHDLFDWLKHSDEHPLIKSSVFHFEFEFIHPFSDGNGRIGRLWQTVILYHWKKVFNVIPIESIVKEHQQEYYDALDTCSKSGKSTYFIEFMLQTILETVVQQVSTRDNVPKDVPKDVPLERAKNILQMISENNKVTSVQIAEYLKVADKTIKRDLGKLKDEGKIERVGGLKLGFWKVL